MVQRCYLLLGSNQGDRAAMLDRAIRAISDAIGPVQRTSSVYETAPWGHSEQPAFLNQVVVADTALGAEETMRRLLAIEERMGRRRTWRNAPRTIDIDLLFYGKEILHTETLQLPHPRLAERRFVLTPLNELSPGFIHPETGRTLHQMLQDCRDPLDVKKSGGKTRV